MLFRWQFPNRSADRESTLPDCGSGPRASHRADSNRRAARVVPGMRHEAAATIWARRRRTPIVRMVAKPIRNSTALLTMAQIDMNADHATTLKLKATNRFNAAEKNISPAQTKPTIKAMSGTSSMATGRQIAVHPSRLQHHDADNGVDHARLDHHKARIVGDQ